MKKLKIVLLFSLIIRIIFINNSSIYKDYEIIEGTVYKITNSYLYLNSKEDIIVKTKEVYNIGDVLKIEGTILEPPTNKVFNLFNYKKYLLSKKIYKQIIPEKIAKIGEDTSFIYKIKKKLLNRLESINNSYLNTLILADNKIDDKIYESYKINGITHLFCISGMHIGIFSFILLFILNIIFKDKRISYLITSILLVIYMLIINTVSVIRSVLIFILICIKKILSLSIETIDLLELLLITLLIINPYYIYDSGFLYSFSISYFLIRFNYLFDDKNYIYKVFLISLISFLVSIPITINNNFEINILSPLLNIFYVPLISIIIFPISLLTFIIPKLLVVFKYLVLFLEKTSIYLAKLKLVLVFPKLNIYLLIIYYILLFLILKRRKKYYYLIYLIFILIIYNIHIFNNYQVTFLDVGQGDNYLLELKNKTILIDTGGNYNYTYYDNVIIPFLKSRGIRKLNYLILSHGDFDHMGEAINLVNSFKVEKVIFNCGEYNDLEKELIEVLDKKKIKYYSCIKELNIDKNKLHFLQTKEYDNENDNSNVIYTKLNGYKFMFMGDAGIEKEKDILDKYNLSNIDVLKVGHHGSRTSSSKEFIDEINPKYSIISVGKNNRYGHPNKEVLENLEDSKIYRTDEDGSIMFKIKNNKLKIEACSS